MRIGFIGAGGVAQTLARLALAFGHPIVLSNSRGPDSLSALVQELGKGAAAGTPQQAAEQDVVVLTVPWAKVQTALLSIPDWKGRLLVDATNRIASLDPISLGDLSGRTSSEIVADLAPGARVVKAFNTVPMAWLSDPSTALFISGDHPEAKQPVRELIEQFGFCCLDLGSLAVGGRLQQLGGALAGVRLQFVERFTI